MTLSLIPVPGWRESVVLVLSTAVLVAMSKTGLEANSHVDRNDDQGEEETREENEKEKSRKTNRSLLCLTFFLVSMFRLLFYSC